MKKVNLYSEFFFYWSLSLVFITLPLPKYNLNSQSIILLLLSWMCYGSLKEKKFIFLSNKLSFFLASSLFWVSLFGLIYTNNLQEGLNTLIKLLPFLVLPLIIYTHEFSKDSVLKFFKIFSYTVIIASCFAIVKGLYFRMNNLGDFFYYSEFSKLLEIHTTYFALFLVIAIAYFIHNLFLSTIKFKRRVITIIYVVFLLIVLYIVSSRISVIAIAISFTTILFVKFKTISLYRKIALSTIVPLLLVVYFISPNFQNRNSKEADFGVSVPKLDTRIVHWEAVINTIKKRSLFFGNGTGDAHQGLYQQYLELGFLEGFTHKYNAHNQFLEILLYYGFIGLLLLLSMILYFMIIALRSKNLTALLLIIIYMIFMVTESILERQNGIVSFVLFLCISSNMNRNSSYVKKG